MLIPLFPVAKHRHGSVKPCSVEFVPGGPTDSNPPHSLFSWFLLHRNFALSNPTSLNLISTTLTSAQVEPESKVVTFWPFPAAITLVYSLCLKMFGSVLPLVSLWWQFRILPCNNLESCVFVVLFTAQFQLGICPKSQSLRLWRDSAALFDLGLRWCRLIIIHSRQVAALLPWAMESLLVGLHSTCFFSCSHAK